MWLSQQIIAAAQRLPAAEVAQTDYDSGAAGLNSYKDLPMCGPWGVAYRPPACTPAVVVESNRGSACIGTFTRQENLAPGELLLFSAGGASIYLKNSGEVLINGQIFPPGGGA